MKNRYSVHKGGANRFSIRDDKRIVAVCSDESEAQSIVEKLNGYDDMKEASVFLFAQTSSMGRE